MNQTQHFPMAELTSTLGGLDLADLRRRFLEQNEYIAVEDFLPGSCLERLLAALPALEPKIHRNFIPKHKKGGSISRFELDSSAPVFPELYRSQAFVDFVGAVTGEKLMLCPPDDPHTYALYYYTEPGDHIGYHYDTSYYRGSRYTILIGLVDQSSCRLECQLYRDDPNRATQTVSVALKPGMLVIFNGDKLYHRVTPLGEGERRVALTLEYVTSTSMNPNAAASDHQTIGSRAISRRASLIIGQASPMRLRLGKISMV
jgi:hypothetical protein